MWNLGIRMEVNASLQPTGWLSFYLERQYTNSELNISVRFTLGLRASGTALNKSMSATHCFTNSRFCYVWPQVLKKEELVHELRPTYLLIVYCEMRPKEECLTIESQTLPHDDHVVIAQNFSDLYTSQKLCDVTINVGDRVFKAHRSVLAARSPIFSSMFEQGMKEEETRLIDIGDCDPDALQSPTFEHDMKEQNPGVIDIGDCDPDAFQDFLTYVYSAKISAISPKNAIALYYIADKYKLPQLTTWCEQFLLLNLSVEMFCEILDLAIKYNRSILIKAAAKFFVKYMEEILVTVKWQSFMKENCTVANQLLIKSARKIKNLITTR